MISLNNWAAIIIHKLTQHSPIKSQMNPPPASAINSHSANSSALLLLIVLLLSSALAAQDLTILPSNTAMNAVNKYVLIIKSLKINIAAGSILALTFPQEYSSATLSSGTYSGWDPSNNDYCLPPNGTLTFSLSGSTLLIGGLFKTTISSTTGFKMQLTVSSFKNPGVLSAGKFLMTIYNGTSNYSSICSSPSFTPSSLSYSLSLSRPTIWDISPLTVTFLPDVMIDSMVLTFPFPWTNQTVIGNAIISAPTCTSNSSPTLTCTLTNFDLLVSNLTYYQTGLPLDITINSIYNPSSLTPIGSVDVSARLGGNQVSTCSITIPGPTFNTDYLRKLSFNTSYQTAADKLTLNISFSIANYGMSTDVYELVFPSGLTMPTASTDYSIIGSNTQTMPTLTFNSTNQSLQFSPFTIDRISQPSINITVKNLARPRQCKTTPTFTINSYRSGFLMDQSSCCALQLPNRLTLLSSPPLLSPQSRLFPSATYTLNLTTALVSLLATDQIKIEFPVEFSGQISAGNSASVCGNVSISLKNNPGSKKPTLGCTVSSNTILLSSFLKNDLPGTETFLITITNLINPSATPLTGFNLATLSSAGYVLEEAKALTFTITPNTLASFTVSASSKTTSQPNVVYTFGVGNNAVLSAGYSIRITFPSDFLFLNYSGMACSVGGAGASCGRANSTYGTATHSILISVTGTVNTIGSVTISGVTNPVSTATTGPFQADILDTTATPVESSNNAPTIAMTALANFPFFIPSTYTSPSNALPREKVTATLNSPSNRVWMYVSAGVWSAGNVLGLKVQLGSQSAVEYSASSYCYSSQFSASSCSFSVNSSSQQVQVDLPSISIPASNYIYLQVANITIKSRSLSLTAFLSINGADAFATPTPVPANPLFLQQVTNYAVALTSTVLSATTDVMLSISLSSKASALASSLRVFIPLEYGVGGYGSHSVLLPNSSLVSGTLTLSGLTNPSTKYYSPFLFTVYDGSNNAIAISAPTDSSKTYSFKLSCSLPCQTCTTATHCLSCYTAISWIPEVYLSTSSNTCVDRCADGTYLTNGQCKPCDPSCKTCLTYGTAYSDGSPTTCLSCSSSKLLLSNQCYSSCPLGYYANNLVCSACMSNCLTCTSRNQCASCQAPLAYYSQQCLSVCPGGSVYYLNISNSQTYCVGCPSNCQLCTSSSTPTCTSCSANYYLSGGACVASCPGGLLPNLTNVCVACQCNTCSMTSYNCTSCSGSKSLFQRQCLLQCPTGYYSASNLCAACSSNCAQCTSSTRCLYCYLPYLLSNQSGSSLCVSSCPPSTIASIGATFSYQCQPCSANCTNCSVEPSHCTSCGPSLVLSDYSCVSSCPSGQFVYNGMCVYCFPDCLICDNVTHSICSQCAPGYFKTGSTCTTACPPSSYADPGSLLCLACNPACATCQNSTNCTTCSTGFLYNAFCYTSCALFAPYNYTANQTCMKCQDSCSSCIPGQNSPSACVDCSDPLIYYYNPTTFTCTTACSSQYFADHSSRQCLPCSAPCATCDTTYNSCLTCQDPLVAYLGQCNSTCPLGYFAQSGACKQCGTNCYMCTQEKCLVCLSFAYLYHSECVLDCSAYSDLPIAVNNYCTSCSQVPYCQACTSTAAQSYDCFLCVYPYVIFAGSCLNECPSFYEADSSRICQLIQSYSSYLVAVQEQNKPKLPPFAFLAMAAICSLLLYISTKRLYSYSYHLGYLLSLLSLIDFSAILYGLYYAHSYYQGDYALHYSSLPVLILASALGLKTALGVTFTVAVVACYYCQDLAYAEWRSQNSKMQVVSMVGSSLLGPRFHKLFYSKLWGKACFSFRVISVEKFYKEDYFNWAVCLLDLLQLSSFLIIAYNIFITYAVLYLMPCELLVIKLLSTLLFMADLRKPDRGFFKGDQQLAEQQILQQQLAKEAAKRKLEVQSLAKLIRCKSSEQLAHPKLYQFLFYDDFRSVYDPKDYEDPPVVPLKKIPKNIERGRFRKGKRISMQQKLKRFAQSLKPEVVKLKDEAYFSKWLYWKPPKRLAQQQKQPTKEADESMLNLLRDKELLYEEDIAKIQVEELQLDSQIRRDHRLLRRNRKKTGFSNDDETIGNRTFYEPSSTDFIELEDQYYVNDLLNRNYAQKKHLPIHNQGNAYDEQELRVLRHAPQKKRERKSRLNELSIRRG